MIGTRFATRWIGPVVILASAFGGSALGALTAASAADWMGLKTPSVSPGWSANTSAGGVSITDGYFVAPLSSSTYWGESTANTSSAVDEIYIVSQGVEYCYPTAQSTDWYDWRYRYNVVSAVADGTGGYSTECFWGQSIAEWSQWQYTNSSPAINIDSDAVDCQTSKPWVFGGATPPCPSGGGGGHGHWW